MNIRTCKWQVKNFMHLNYVHCETGYEIKQLLGMCTDFAIQSYGD